MKKIAEEKLKRTYRRKEAEGNQEGGHLLYYTLELVAGRPIPEKIQAMGYQIGLFLVVGIMALALFNDFARL